MDRAKQIFNNHVSQLLVVVQVAIQPSSVVVIHNLAAPTTM
jgi:hypothetical protein